MVSSEIDESIFHHIEMTFSKTTFEFRRDGLEKALVKVLSEKETIHVNELLNRIFFELLHSDLSDVIYPTLPTLNEFQNGYIAQDGPILLEIVECIEVGISTYKLLQILDEFESSQINNAEDGSEKRLVFPRKMLYLLLSDGQQQIKGVEYKQIPELGLHTPIGKKILINNVKYSENILFLTPENTYVCEGFEWTSRRLGDLRLTFMELLGIATNESVEDESQISYNALHPFDNVQPAFSPSNMDGRLARVIFKNVPNMPELTKLKRFLLKAETSNPPPRPPRPVLSHNETSLRHDSIVRASSSPILNNSIQPNSISPISRVGSTFNNSTRCNLVAPCPEPVLNNSTRFNSMSRTLHPEPNFITRSETTVQPNPSARISSCGKSPPLNDSMQPNANEEPPNSEQPYIMSSRLKNVTKSSFTKPTLKAPLRQLNVDTSSSTRLNPSSKQLYNEPAGSWNKPEESEPNFRDASMVYNNCTEPAFKKSSTLYNPPTNRYLSPAVNASSIRSNSGGGESLNNRPSYDNTSRSHLSISSNEPDFNASPIRPNSRFNETVSCSMHSNPGVDPFSIQEDDFSFMLIDDNINTYHNNDNELYSKKGSADKSNDFHNDDVILIDSDCELPPAKDIRKGNNNNVITENTNNPNHISEETKNKLSSLFESLENEYKEYKVISELHSRNDGNVSIKSDSSDHNKNKRSWLYEEIDCDNDMGLNDFELPPVKRVNYGTGDREEKLNDGSLANPIILDYDDKDYEMDLDEILSGYF